jgi:pteridine reductase
MTSSRPVSAGVALITGAAQRIGAVVAEQLHEAGYRVVLHCNHSIDQAQTLCAMLNQRRDDSAYVVTANLCNMEEVEYLAREAQAKWGRLDVLVNNASSFYPTPVGSITAHEWDDLIGTNLKAPLFLSQALATELRSRHGSIINIADVHADRPLSRHPVYCAAKAGNVMLTQSLAKDLAPDVRVNGVAPGAILWPENEGELSDDNKQAILGKIALNRLGTPRDIARTIRFLVTDAPYITGQIIAVDGGRSLVS